MEKRVRTAILDRTLQEQVCLNCGMLESDWKGDQGRGFWVGSKPYCCEGCAENTGCICADEDERD